MNNSDNNETKVESFDAISLGNVNDGNSEKANPIPVVPPVAPVPPIDSAEKKEEIQAAVVSEIPEPVDVQSNIINDSLKNSEQINDVSSSNFQQVDALTPVESEAKPEETPAPIDPIQSFAENNGGIGVVPPVNPNDAVGDLTSNAAGIIPPVAPVAPVAPVEPVAPVNYEVPESIDSFNPSPLMNEIGAMPPIPDIPEAVQSPNVSKSKKGMNKTLFVVIIILALAAVGAGVYIFLNMGQKANASVVKPKKVTIEVGSEVSVDINDYATFNGIDSSTCQLDTTEITDTSKLNAEYKFKITCDDASYTGTVTIVDTVVPDAVIKKEGVKVPVNGEVKPEDFIEECNDATACIVTFKDEEKVKENVKVASSYKILLVISDEAGNKIEKEGILIVDDNLFVEASMYLIAEKKTDKYIESLKMGIEDGSFTKSAIRTYRFELEEEVYNSFAAENKNKSSLTYQNITGKPKFNDSDKTLSLSIILTYDDLNKEENITLPLVISELNDYYSSKGYECHYGL